jgi:hypothetical protein
MSAWHIDGKQRVFRGLPIQEYIRQKQPDIKIAAPTLPLPPPSRPDWADQIYHPTMVPRTSPQPLRRKSGKRFYPHGFIWGGNDVRQPFFPSGYPMQCIGRVFAYSDPSSFVWSDSGTGVLVGPNTVLTASHVVPWNANPAMIEFVPAYFNGVSTVGPNVSSFVDAASAYDLGSPPAAAFDFAILRLQDRLGDGLGWLGTKSYDAGWNDNGYWTLVGYAGAIDNAEQPSIQSGISFHDDDEDSNDFGNAMELETQNGDSSPGDSGGPYFAFWTDGPYVVGVDVGGEEEYFFFPFTTEDNNVASAGPAMVQLVQWARDNWG